MDIRHRICINKNMRLLRRDLDVREIVPYLQEHLLIGDEQVERVYAVEISTADKAERLLNYVKQGSNRMYTIFLEAIKESDSCHFIHETLIKTEVTKHDIETYTRSLAAPETRTDKPRTALAEISNIERPVEQADCSSPKKPRTRSRSRSIGKVTEMRPTTSLKSQRRTLEAIVISRHPGNDKRASVIIHDGLTQTSLVAFTKDERAKLNDLLIRGKYKFKAVVECAPNPKFSSRPTYKYDKHSLFTLLSREHDIPFSSLTVLKSRDRGEYVNVRGFLVKIDRDPIGEASRAVACIWLQSDGVQTCLLIYSNTNPVLKCEPGAYIEVHAGVVSDIVLREEKKILVALRQLPDTYVLPDLSPTEVIRKHFAPEPLIRQIHELRSVADVKPDPDRAKWCTVVGKLDSFQKQKNREKRSSGLFQYLACPFCKTDIEGCDGMCPKSSCRYDAEESDVKPQYSVVLNVSVRDVDNTHEADPIWLVMFSSARFFEQLPSEHFGDLDEEAFLSKRENQQISCMNRIFKKELVFRFTFRVQPPTMSQGGNPIVEMVERMS